MDEYIKRETIIERLEKNLVASNHGSWGELCYHDAINSVKGIPAADVAPVVRCRDCKHAWIHPCGYVYCHRDGRNAYEMTFNLDSFCSYGERKDNG